MQHYRDPAAGPRQAEDRQRLGWAATAGEGAQNLLCAYMAAGVLAGLRANAVLGWWWLDPAVALGIAVLAVREGREAWAGEGCCVPTPITGLEPTGRCAPGCRD